MGARPYAPQDLDRYLPAAGVADWVQSEILATDGSIHNPDHAHLLDADLELLWAPAGFTKAMKTVIGQAEEVMIRAGGWQKGRQEQQFEDWFGRVPGFMITLDADYCTQCSDADWCALRYKVDGLKNGVDVTTTVDCSVSADGQGPQRRAA